MNDVFLSKDAPQVKLVTFYEIVRDLKECLPTSLPLLFSF